MTHLVSFHRDVVSGDQNFHNQRDLANLCFRRCIFGFTCQLDNLVKIVRHGEWVL